MADYYHEMALAQILRSIADHQLTGEVTEITIEVTPGPVDKSVNTRLCESVETILTNSPFKLKEFSPHYPYTRIIIERRKHGS